MITKINLRLDLPKENRTFNIGSTLHGVIMEMLPKEIIEFLHSNSKYSPLKQRVILSQEYTLWEIILLNDEVAKHIQTYFIDNNEIHIKRHDIKVNINSYTVEKIEIKNLIEKHFQEENPKKYIKIQVKTPMSFKSNGKYEIYPDVRKMFRSSMLIFDTFFEEYKMYDKETLDFIERNVEIIDYNLKSTRFHLENVKIPSFVGQITLKVHGANTFVQLINFLLEYGSLTGIGIKTSIGMGKYEII